MYVPLLIKHPIPKRIYKYLKPIHVIVMLEVQEQNMTFVVQNTYKYIYICKEHSIVCISTLMIINKIVLVVH